MHKCELQKILEVAMGLIHGGDIVGFMEQFGREPIDFSANVNPFGVPLGVKQAIIDASESCDLYPDPLSRKLTYAIAQSEGVFCENIICGNGAADLIFRIVLAKKPKKALITAPTFAEYEQALETVGCEIVRHYLLEEDDFNLTQSVIEKLDGIDMAFFCNPNNPTGKTIEPKLLQKIADICKEKNITLIVDECFNEFLDCGVENSLKTRLADCPNLFILKAFTKLYAMAGVRLGYGMCSNGETIELMRKCGQPWAVSSIAQAAGIAALKEHEYVEKTLLDMRLQREYLCEKLKENGQKVIGCAANYIFFKTEIDGLGERLKKKNILTRNCGNYAGLNGFYYRIGIKKHAENMKLIEAFKSVLEEQNG